jgi:ABC-2 type transport system permease protein
VLDGGRRVFDKPISDLRPLLGREGSPADAEVVAVSLAVKRAMETSSPLILPPVITLESELFGTAPAPDQEKGSGSRSLIFLAVLPGVAVYGLFLVAEQGMRDVLTERTMGTLRRQLASPLRPSIVILGKALYTAVLAALAILVLSIVGATALTTPVSPTGFLLVSASLVLAVTGTNAAIYGLSRTERQAATIGNIIFLAMGFLGGGFIRVEGLPPMVQAIAPFTPLYWGTRGFRALLESGAGPAGVLLPAAVLAAMGLALLSVGAAALRRAANA